MVYLVLEEVLDIQELTVVWLPSPPLATRTALIVDSLMEDNQQFWATQGGTLSMHLVMQLRHKVGNTLSSTQDNLVEMKI